MSEMSQKESQQADGKNDAMGPQEASGLGALLKNEREKRGLSYEQVAQITRLRRHFLEALENEEWHNLPPSVFVKGFIRSYAKALGMEESKLLELYKNTLPEDVAPPTPIIEPRKSKKAIVLALVLLLGALAATLYLWMGKPSPEQATVQTQKELPSEIQAKPSEKVQPVVQKSEEGASVKEMEVSADFPRPSTGLAEMDIPEPLPDEKEPDEYPTDEDLFVASTTEPSATTDWLVLTGIVHLRTWIRIYIDDETPKEYILQPGSRAQWKAREGFYVLVGNAAGIDFDFNGRELSDLGGLGQVVSLRLPDSFKRQISED
jgi:cytoskeleton protein RodZ